MKCSFVRQGRDRKVSNSLLGNAYWNIYSEIMLTKAEISSHTG
jgi:hypothetical protein